MTIPDSQKFSKKDCLIKYEFYINVNSFECLLPYDELAEGPGVAREKKIEKNILKK